MQYSTSQAVALILSGEVLCPVCLQVLDVHQKLSVSAIQFVLLEPVEVLDVHCTDLLFSDSFVL